ncbi:hypothetical protein ACEPPN_006511 [Leptodophora sp. 'Broadleaf-Isolate-01']
MEKRLPENHTLREALNLTPELKDTKEIVLGALILSQWSSRGVRWTEDKEAEQRISQSKISGLVLVSANLTWEAVKQLSSKLGEAGGFLQQPSGCKACKRMLLYNPQSFYRPGQILWEVLGEDPGEVGIRD